MLNFLHMVTGVLAWFALVSIGKSDDAPRIWLENGHAVVSKEAPEEVKRVVAAANEIAGKPYKWGGGHGQFEDSGYDCSGAASYVLREAGLMKGVRASSGFLDFGEKGEGQWITVWARKGHVFITVAGLRFDTLGQDAADGPKWTEKSRDLKRFTARRPTAKGL